jgi:hypothetical protein
MLLACINLTEWSRVRADITSIQKRKTGLASGQPNKFMGWCAGPGKILIIIELQKNREKEKVILISSNPRLKKYMDHIHFPYRRYGENNRMTNIKYI